MENKTKILIVEDDLDINEVLCSLLEQENFDVSSTSNGKEALIYLKSHPRPDLILLDRFMPIMDGMDFRKQQLETLELKDIPTILMTAETPHDLKTLDSFQASLKKPFSIDDFFKVLNHVLGSQK